MALRFAARCSGCRFARGCLRTLCPRAVSGAHDEDPGSAPGVLVEERVSPVGARGIATELLPRRNFVMGIADVLENDAASLTPSQKHDIAEILIDAAQHDDDDLVRAAAVRSLGNMEALHRGVTGVLLEALSSDREPDVRCAAADSLANVEPTEPMLQALCVQVYKRGRCVRLDDCHGCISQAASRAVREILARSPEGPIRDRVLLALSRYSPDPDDWIDDARCPEPSDGAVASEHGQL